MWKVVAVGAMLGVGSFVGTSAAVFVWLTKHHTEITEALARDRTV